MNKTPCIKCTPEIWEYIEPFLINWRYVKCYDFSYDWETYPILVIDYCGVFGRYSNISNISNIDGYDRELITDINIFLDKAAKLKGFTYKRKIMEINGVEIKPGMIIETVDSIRNSKSFWIVFPTKKGLAITRWGYSSWEYINEFVKYHSKDIENIYDCVNGESLTSGDVLWGKSKEIVITMDEIAEKFGYPIEQIRIMK